MSGPDVLAKPPRGLIPEEVRHHGERRRHEDDENLPEDDSQDGQQDGQPREHHGESRDEPSTLHTLPMGATTVSLPNAHVSPILGRPVQAVRLDRAAED